MDAVSKTRTVYNFLNTCYKCLSNIEYPLLSDFSYGESIFQTSDGQGFFLADLINNQTFDFINEFLESKAGQKISKANSQKILAQLADKIDGKEVAIDYPICPNCKRKQMHFNDNTPTTQREISFATWIEFEELTLEEKIERIKAVISLNKKSIF